MYNSENIIQDIKSRISIVDIISEYTKLTKKGKNYVGLCPFHQEKTPSFTVNLEKGLFHCFGCSVGGNIFNFVMLIEKLSFPEAIRFLAKKANISIPYYKSSEEDFKKQEIYKIIEKAANKYHEFLTLDVGKEAINYLKSRNLNMNTIKEFYLGYAPSGNILYETFRKENYSENILIDSGLCKKSDQQFNTFDRFRDRIIFPIFSLSNKIIGFGGRSLHNEEPKYLNSPDTIVFKKSDILYGLEKAKDDIIQKSQLLLMEGYFDVILSHQNGIKNAVASLGTALTKNQAVLISRYAKEVVIIYDPDLAGEQATLRSIMVLIASGLNIKVLRLPFSVDPSDFFVQYGSDDFIKLIQSAPDIFSYIIESLSNKVDLKKSEGKIMLLNTIFPIIKELTSEIKKEEVFDNLKDVIKTDKEVIKKEYIKFVKTGMHSKPKHEYNTKIDPDKLLQKELTLLLCENPQLIKELINSITIDDFSDEISKIIYNSILEAYNSNAILTTDRVLDFIPDMKIKEYITDALFTEKYKINPEKQLSEILLKFKIRKIDAKMESIQNRLKEIIGSNNILEITQLQEEYQFLRNEKEKLIAQF